MQRGFRLTAWYKLVVPVLGILCGSHIMPDLVRFAILHHSIQTRAFFLELQRP
jgi:hypothetical protein